MLDIAFAGVGLLPSSSTRPSQQAGVRGPRLRSRNISIGQARPAETEGRVADDGTDNHHVVRQAPLISDGWVLTG